MQIIAKHLAGEKQGTTELFTELPIAIGRAPSNHLRLAINDVRASAAHAVVEVDGHQIVIRDAGSTNGTFVNGKLIRKSALRSKDIVEFGSGGPKLQFEFKDVTATPAKLPDPAPKVSSGRRHETPESSHAGSVSQALDRDEEVEFIKKSRFKFIFIFPGLLALIAGIVVLFLGKPLHAIPLILGGVVVVLMGWSSSRRNITISPAGIVLETPFKTVLIRWEDVVSMHTRRHRTQVLTYAVYCINGKHNRIIFAPAEYVRGFDLIRLAAKRAGQQWK